MTGSHALAPGLLALLLPAIVASTTGMVRADSAPHETPGPLESGWPACERALQDTLAGGKPTVLVIGSRSQPASLTFLKGLVEALPGQPLARSLNWVELDAEADAETVRRTGVSRFPALLVYRRAAQGLEVAGHRAGLTDPFFALGWLDTLGLVPARAGSTPASTVAHAPTFEPATLDDAIAPTQYPASPQAQASPQAPAAPPKAPAPPALPVPVAPAPPQPQPIYAAPVAPQPVYVQAPSSPIVFQQPQQQIVLAPPPPPQITVAMPAAASPSITYAVPPPAAAPPSNLFLAPQPAAPVAMAPQPMMAAQPMMAPAAPPAYAVAAAPVAQSPITTTAALLLLNPNLIDRILGTLGEHLAQRKQPRVALAPQQPLLSPMMALAPAAAPVALAPVSSLSAPASPMMVPAAAPSCPVEPPAVPSPQVPHKKHGWFHR